MSEKTVIIVTGPTASGKTDLALELASYYKTSIISADSRQCFRELQIGVARPDEAQLFSAPHFFINSHSIHEEVNAAIFENLALQWCDEVFANRDTVIMCGGTGLYIKAFRDGLDAIPMVNSKIREDILSAYDKQGIDWLRESLKTEDILYYESGELSNPQRMMRALEVVRSTGRSIISFRLSQRKQRSFRILEYAIRLPKKELYNRINERVDKMMERGLLEEVKSLLAFQHLNALQTVGYSELFQYLLGKSDLNSSILKIKQNTRHYAKRQLTWLKKNENLIWLEADFMDQILKNR